MQERTRSLIFSGALALVLAVALALLLARLIARPLEEVTTAAARVAGGDLTVRLPVAGRSRGGESETSRLARSFNKMAESLERLENDRKAMVADVAHELRTPLTIMRGRLKAIEDGLASLEMAEVQDLHRQVLLLSRLVEDLRMLSLAEAGRLALELADLDLADLVHKVVTGFRVRALAEGVELGVDCAGEVRAWGDRERLIQVISNLLDNALRHTSTGGRISVRLSDGEPGPSFEVVDQATSAEPSRTAALRAAPATPNL